MKRQGRARLEERRSRIPRGPGEVISRRVRLLAYDHVADPAGRDVTREHEFGPGVELRALADGSLLIRHARGKQLWAEE